MNKDQLKIRVWAEDGQWHGRITDYDRHKDWYNVVYEATNTRYGDLLINLALSLIRNTEEEIE